MSQQFLQSILFLTLYIPCAQILAAPAPSTADDLQLIILHNNDMHARFEQTGVNSNKCTDENVANNKCYGGFARTAHEIRRFRKDAANGGPPVLYLNAGDTYTGTAWFAVFKDNITAAFLNILKPDAISLGNHEFDEGVEGLIPFLNKADFPVLAANLDFSKTPELAATRSLKSSHLFIINGVKIGVIGYVTPDTKKLTTPNNVEFLPEIAAINKEAEVLKKEGVNIIIALGHSGFEMDKEIGTQCPLVDIVIGGHTNTFLYNGASPSVETPEGPYPVVVKQKSGKKVPIVQAYAYTKYLGRLRVTFNSNGDLTKFNGQPILLDSSVPQDEDVLALLETYRPNITDLEQSVVGYTKVALEGNSKVCREMECNLGNFIADSMVHARVLELKESTSGSWTDAAIAFVQGGGIRSSIDKKDNGAITKNDVLSVLPFGNKLHVVKVPGKVIRAALERSASKLIDTNSNGGFLQMSGVHVVYDQSKPLGQMVVDIQVLCAECDIPIYSKLEDQKSYNIILPTFLLEGGDGHDWGFPTNQTKNVVTLKAGDVQAVNDLLAERSPIYPSTEWRIRVLSTNHSSSASRHKQRSFTLAIVPVVTLFLFKFY